MPLPEQSAKPTLQLTARWARVSVAVLHAVGEIDLLTVGSLERMLAALGAALTEVDPARDVDGAPSAASLMGDPAATSGPAALVCDLSAATFLSARGIDVLVAAHERASEAGIGFQVVAPDGVVRRALRVTGVDRTIPLTTTLSDTAPSAAGRAGRS